MTAAAWHSKTLMHAFQPQSVANMIWAYASLAHNPPGPFLEALCEHAAHQLPHFSPQNISNTIWALATLKWHGKVSLGVELVECDWGVVGVRVWACKMVQPGHPQVARQGDGTEMSLWHTAGVW